MIVLLILSTAGQAPPAQQPDIQLDAHVTARRIVVDNRGHTGLTVRTSVNGREADQGNVVHVDAPELPPGRRELRNVTVHVRAETRIPDPTNPQPPPQEPASPQ